MTTSKCWMVSGISSLALVLAGGIGGAVAQTPLSDAVPAPRAEVPAPGRAGDVPLLPGAPADKPIEVAADPRSNFDAPGALKGGRLTAVDASAAPPAGRTRAPNELTAEMRYVDVDSAPAALGEIHECVHRIVLTDTTGGYWNGGQSYVDVYVDGELTLAGLTIANQEPPEEIVVFLAADGSVITTVFFQAPGWVPATNAEYCIYDGANNLLGCDGLGGVVPSGMTVSGACVGTGACCNKSDGVCSDNVDVWACLPPLAYTNDTLCSELPEPCGNPGACCHQAVGFCTQQFEVNCTGRFEPGALCEEDPFTPPCGAYNTCNVLIVPAETEFEYTSPGNDFMARLAAHTFSAVDFMDGTATTPTLAELQAYDMVITYADNNYADKYLMGDNLADYVETGGRVLLGNYSVYTQGNWTWLDGRIIEEYNPAEVTAPNNYGVTYLEDGTDCIFEGVGAYEALGSDVITAAIGPAKLDGTYHDPDPWATPYAPVAAIRHDRTVTYVSGHLAGYVMFQAADREELAKLTANICYCEPDETLLGACCDPFVGTCSDNVPVTECLPPLKWTEATLCDDLPVPCGNPGACCSDAGGACTEEFEKNCDGRFAAGQTCESATFDRPCGESGLYDILYVPTAGDNPMFRAELATILNSNVDYLYAHTSTPTLAELMQYAAVVTWADLPYADGTGEAMGDVLADYVEAGGKVILGLWALPGGGNYNYVSGRLREEYSPSIVEDTWWGGGDYDGSGTDCIHDGVEMYGSPVIDVITRVTPNAWFDSLLVDEDGNSSYAVTYLIDRSVYHISGFASLDGTTNGPGQWAELVANMVRCDEPVEVRGACCTFEDGGCVEDVLKQDCPPPLQWTYDTACADLDPQCGWPGACCDDSTGTCSQTTFMQCAGRHQIGENCASAVFDPPCGQYEPCEHTLTAWAQYNFSWVEGYMDIFVGGLMRVANVTLLEGTGSLSLTFDAEDGEEITTVWHPGKFDGGWDFVASYCISGLNGEPLVCDENYNGPTGVTTSGSCTPVACGDGSCHIGGGESCATCETDCGTCRCVSQLAFGGEVGIFSDLNGSPVQLLANDFALFQTTEILAVNFWGQYDPGNTIPADDFTMIFLESNGRYPAGVVAVVDPVVATRTDIGGGTFMYSVDAGITLPPGQYFLEIYNNTIDVTEKWAWNVSDADEPFGLPGIIYSQQYPEFWDRFEDDDLAFELICEVICETDPDINNDGTVDAADLAALLGAWGQCLPCCPADLNQDGVIGAADLALLLGSWS